MARDPWWVDNDQPSAKVKYECSVVTDSAIMKTTKAMTSEQKRPKNQKKKTHKTKYVSQSFNSNEAIKIKQILPRLTRAM